MPSKKDYVAVAKILHKYTNQSGVDTDALATANDIALDLAYYFQGDNPRFDMIRFLDAAGVEEK